MSEALIIDAVRTPRAIGKPGKGAYAGMHPQHLASTVLKAIQQRNDLNTPDIDDVIWGTSAQKGLQGGDMGRMAALDAGFDVRVSGVTLDRFCGSGLTATNLAAGQLKSGLEDLIIAGGTEMMSMITTVGQQEREAGLPSLGLGTGNVRLQKRLPQSNQGVCADAVASMEGIGREALDAFGLESQRRAARAIQEGRFDRSIVPVIGDDGQVVLAKDEYPRPQTTAQDLAALKPSFAQIADMPANRRRHDVSATDQPTLPGSQDRTLSSRGYFVGNRRRCRCDTPRLERLRTQTWTQAARSRDRDRQYRRRPDAHAQRTCARRPQGACQGRTHHGRH